MHTYHFWLWQEPYEQVCRSVGLSVPKKILIEGVFWDQSYWNKSWLEDYCRTENEEKKLKEDDLPKKIRRPYHEEKNIVEGAFWEQSYGNKSWLEDYCMIKKEENSKMKMTFPKMERTLPKNKT